MRKREVISFSLIFLLTRGDISYTERVVSRLLAQSPPFSRRRRLCFRGARSKRAARTSTWPRRGRGGTVSENHRVRGHWMAGNVRDSARGLRRSRRREALINLARESNPTRETGVGETVGGDPRGGSGSWGGREGEAEGKQKTRRCALSPRRSAGETGDRERRRLSRKFGNYRCRVVVLFLSSPVFFFFLLFFRRVILIWERQFVFAARAYLVTRGGDAAASQRDASRRSAH